MIVLRRDNMGGNRLKGFDTSGTDIQSPAEDYTKLLNKLGKDLDMTDPNKHLFKATGSAKITQEAITQSEAAAVLHCAMTADITSELAGHKWKAESWSDPKGKEVVAMVHQFQKQAKERNEDLEHTNAEFQNITLAAIRMSRTLTHAAALPKGTAAFMDEVGNKARNTEKGLAEVLRTLKKDAQTVVPSTSLKVSLGPARLKQIACKLVAQELQGTQPYTWER
jgi:hypothetical protein